MVQTEALKRAQKTYYEKNRAQLLAYKSKYWQLNKHKWSSRDTKLRDQGKTEPVGNNDISEPEANATAAMN
jgi:hypothetical protein